MADEYNGYTNYETWNVALWIQNDEGLYAFAKEYSKWGYKAFVNGLRIFVGEISQQTPDGVAWQDPALNIEELDKMMGDL